MIYIKDYIEYFYNFNNITLFKDKKNYKFIKNNITYSFVIQNRNNMELIEIDNITRNNDMYDQIVYNKYGDMITNIDNKNYILIKKTYKYDIINSILNSKNAYTTNSINRSNWVNLWSKKIDYIEYQLLHIENEYSIIKNSIWYYIGMSENAISYINSVNKKNNYVVSHRRILNSDFNDPQNIIVDYKSRDICEYLKYIFINKKYNYSEIKIFFNNLNMEKYLYELVYGRMFFPTFYFDLYDEIINRKQSEDILKEIIIRSQEYEDYIKNIYKIILEFYSIPEISWI